MEHFARSVAGGTEHLATMRAQALLAGHVGNQAFIQAISDDFLIAAAITFLGAIPILFLRTRKNRTAARPVPVE
jgi:cellobiose-specific phosphotransferase system component IIC